MKTVSRIAMGPCTCGVSWDPFKTFLLLAANAKSMLLPFCLGTELRDKQALRCIRSGEYFLQILEKCISEGICVRVVTRKMMGRKASIDGFNVNVRRFRADGFHDGAP